MNRKAHETIKSLDMLANTKTIVVGVSGGADSISLLHFLLGISKKYNIEIIAAHVNHKIRGEESDRDEKFVRDICNKWGVRLFVKKENIIELSAKLGKGMEECGREVRYKYFSELSNMYGAKIATAHTLSDSMETVFLNLSRGCGIKGLCGIPPVRENIIRPLINCSRQDVEKYCKDNNLDFVNDSTNFSCDYNRNKIRMNVVPVLKDINPSLENVFIRFLDNISSDSEYLEEISFKEFINLKDNGGFNVDKLKNLPKPIKNRVIIYILKHFTDKSPESKTVDNVIRLINSEINCISINKDINMIIRNGFLEVNSVLTSKKEYFFWEYKIQTNNVLTEAKKSFIISVLTPDEYFKLSKNDKNILKNCVSLDGIGVSGITFRNRRPSDTFSPFGRGITKKVKRLFNELKIPLNIRNDVPMLSFENRLLWIYGVGVSEEYKVNSDTKSILMIREVENCNVK